MYLIKDKNNRFIKKTIDNQITFTNSESLADAFPSEREANDVIRKIFTKKNRKNYKAVWRDINPVPESTIGKQQNDESSDDTYMLSIKGFDEVISTHLTPEIEKHLQKLQEYDGMILDIRHWLRDENTKLNVCQGYKAVKRLQDIERARAACKKELQRVLLLRKAVNRACQDSVNFEYDEYKKRQIQDVRAFIFEEQNTQNKQ